MYVMLIILKQSNPQRGTKPGRKPLKNMMPDGKTAVEQSSPALRRGDWSPSSPILRLAASALNITGGAAAASKRTPHVAIPPGRGPAAAGGRRYRHQSLRHGLDLRRFSRTLERRASGPDREPASGFCRRWR